MDREAQAAAQTEASRHHRRSVSHVPSSSSGKDFGRERLEKLQDMARIKTSSHLSKAGLGADYVLPGIPSPETPLLSATSHRTDAEEARTGKYERARPLMLHRQSSLEELGIMRIERSRSKTSPSKDKSLKNAHLAARPRQARPAEQQSSNTVDSVALSVDGTATASTSKASRMSREEHTPPNRYVRGGLGRGDTKQMSENFDLERRGSPGRSVYGRRMLHLMGKTRGEMSGRLSFRTEPSQQWTSASCYIDKDTGSLLCEHKNTTSFNQPLVEDLRGCRVQTLLDPEYSSAILVLRPKDNPDVIQLQPEDGAQVDTWFAAFLCWQALQPMQMLSGSAPSNDVKATAAIVGGSNSREQASMRKGPAIIKVGKAFYLEPSESDAPFELSSPSKVAQDAADHASQNSPLWKRVSCTLRDNGELKIYTTADVSILATIKLSDLTRSAVQRVHSSVSRLEFCVAIYPKFAVSQEYPARPRPIFLSFDSRVLFEVWFVLFSTFTSPEIQRFGPPPTAHSRRYSVMLPGAPQEAESFFFRVERSLNIQVAEARLKSLNNDGVMDQSGASPRRAALEMEHSPSALCFAQVSLDGQLKAKTSVKPNSPYLFWYESFNILDVPPHATDIVVQARCRTLSSAPGSPRLHRSQRGILSARRSESMQTARELDTIHGEVRIDLNKLQPAIETERWWKISDESGKLTGELLLKIRPEREVILMDCEYAQLSELLHHEPCHMTTRIAEKIPAELSRLADCLLNVFQASGRVGDWLMSLAEEEIEGIRKDMPSGRSRSKGRMDSNASRNSAGSPTPMSNQVSLVNNLAMSEANLLFRGNTLLSKSLDLHMKRLGKDYLEGTLGAKVRMIADQDPECEVDPNRLKNGMDLQENWQRLLSLTREVWTLIYDSCSRCPIELRMIFRHIRACTDDRYGDRLPNVRYSSVSGFLFLRFFCPAVLNPSLFGLLNENPTARAQRTFTLIAKSLQGLANQALFGVKEPWMGSMNQFLNAYTQQFKDFLDSICSLSRDQEVLSISPSYSTPLAMFTRLPQMSREGLPSLPYLIDHTRHFAALVSLWTESFPSKASNIAMAVEGLDPDLRHFHEICARLRRRTQSCLAQTEQDEKRRSTVSEKWQELAKRIDSKPGEFWVDPGRSALPMSRLMSDVKLPTNGRSTPSTPVSTSGGIVIDEATANGLISGPPSSIQLSSPTSSEPEQLPHSPTSKGKRDAREKDNSMLNLFTRRIRR